MSISVKTVHGDLWPDRDRVCYKSAYEFEGADIAISLCPRRDVVIQAGGNVGAWPRYLSTIFSEVHTFEPSVENFNLMVDNLNGNVIFTTGDVTSGPINGHPNIHARLAALYDTNGKCSIKINPYNCGDDQTIPGEDIETVTIDSLNLRPNLIYLDIQGDEYRALKGGIETIERCSPVIAIEYDKKLKMRSPVDAVEYLEQLGYVKYKQFRQDWIFTR